MTDKVISSTTMLHLDIVFQQMDITEDIHKLDTALDCMQQLITIKNSDLSDPQVHNLLCQDTNLVKFCGGTISVESLGSRMKQFWVKLREFFAKLYSAFEHLFADILEFNFRLKKTLEALKRTKLARLNEADPRYFASRTIYGYTKEDADAILSALGTVSNGLKSIAKQPETFAKTDIPGAFKAAMNVLGWDIGENLIPVKTNTAKERRNDTLSNLRWTIPNVVIFTNDILSHLNDSLRTKADTHLVLGSIKTSITTMESLIGSKEYTQSTDQQKMEYIDQQRKGLVFYKTMATTVYYESVSPLGRQCIKMIQAMRIREI